MEGQGSSPEFNLPVSRLSPGRDMVAVRVEADSPIKTGMLWDYLAKVGVTVLGAMLNTGPKGVIAYGILDVTDIGREAAEGILRSVPIEDLRVEVVERSTMGFVGTVGLLKNLMNSMFS
ncbi:hypothetical protein [Conexivisphaera calida]|uniref:Uncharacterized protein n=1 Tax=Conexivisphaera calida TaxID=1874277 RepID=A0A4P2VLP5_9ARCH|nr:hypothetical protein [Conexivisphaera calida]BBE42055.1 hypothetical protein NAS2_0666 [Conexivisphaera calida]